MNHPGKKKEERKPRRHRYRLNKKKFTTMLLVLGCIAALVVIAVVSLENADVNAVAMGIPGVPEATEHVIIGADQTQKADTDYVLDGRLIVLDAGHGGFDPGAIGVSGTYESELNLVVARYLKAALEDCGAQVIMTREDDVGLGETQDESLRERRRIVEQSGSDIVVSIHMNSHETDFDVSGPLVLFMPGSEEGKKLAEKVQKNMDEKLDASGIARSQSLYILKSGNQPCILVECGYLSNKEEERKLNQQEYQKKVAKAICEGIGEYFLQTEMKD